MVDTALTITLMGLFGLPAPIARVPAFIVATLATFTLNRAWTFAGSPTTAFVAGWFRYVISTAGSSLLNYLVYYQFVSLFGHSTLMVIAGIGLGSLIGLVFNYAASSRLVFRP